jgi:hypothetical protein
VNAKDPPETTGWGVDGLIVPPTPALGVTVSMLVDVGANAAVTVQSAVMVPVVYVVPLSEPLQPVTVAMVYPESGVTVNWVVWPDCT